MSGEREAARAFRGFIRQQENPRPKCSACHHYDREHTLDTARTVRTADDRPTPCPCCMEGVMS